MIDVMTCPPGLDRAAGGAHEVLDAADFVAALAELSRDLTADRAVVSRPQMHSLLVKRSEALGLRPAHLLEDLRRGLRQEGALGADEREEYRRYLRRFRVQEPAKADFEDLHRLFTDLGCFLAGTSRRIASHLEGDCPVFLGTDAETLKLAYDIGSGSSHASKCFYISRRSLMTPSEREVLHRRRHAMFGPQGTSKTTADGSEPGRAFAWWDNSLAYSLLYQMIRRCRQRPGDGGPSDLTERLTETMYEELTAGTLQAERVRQGSLCFFGQPDAEVRAVLRRSVEERSFARLCLGHIRRLYKEVLRSTRRATLIDIGATGTQPLFLLAALGALSRISPGLWSESVRGPRLTPEDCDMLEDLRSGDYGLRVILFAADGSPWPAVSPTLAIERASAELALAVESMKTVKTSLEEDRHVTSTTAPQRLLAFYKHLVIRNAILERGPSEGEPQPWS